MRISDWSSDVCSSDLISGSPVRLIRPLPTIGAPHRKIALPRDLFGTGRPNSSGLDLTNEQRLASLSAALLAGVEQPCRAAPLLGEGDPDGCGPEGAGREVRNPAATRAVVGTGVDATADTVDRALAQAVAGIGRTGCRATGDQ